MQDEFKLHVNNNLPFLYDGKLLLAISGGLDSVVLCHLCMNLDLNIALAHCNFHLRANESDEDEKFVIKLAEQLEVEIFVQHFETEKYAKNHKISTQMAARDLRYKWFSELADQLDFDFIMTAHHADDDLETFIINLSRGTGLEGLSGIPMINGNVVRPLLSFSREMIEKHALDNKIEWREDSSNASNKYLRNKIRHEIIPGLKELNPRFLESFNVTQEHLKEARSLIDDQLDAISDQVIEVKDDCIHFDIDTLKELSNTKAYLFELLKDYGFSEWNDVSDLLESQSGKQVFSEHWRLLKDRNALILKKKEIVHDERILIDAKEKQIETPIGVLFFDEADAIFGSKSNIIHVDKDKLQFPLSIRKWEEGDVFYPFGMEGKKKISKYFKDEKLSLIEKEETWLLCSGEDIVWVIGMRADDRFKISGTTMNKLKIELQ